MAQFTIEIAGQRIRVESLFESTRDYCRAYFSSGEPDHFVSVRREALAREQELWDQEAVEEGFRRRKFSDPFLERAVIQRAVAEHLFEKDILLFHGSALAVDGDGYLFTARSGTGKSTHTRLWCRAFGQRAVMINDDKPFLRIAQEPILVCGAPWSGKHGLDSNLSVPLKGICILERGTENQIRPLQPEEAVAMLLHQAACPDGKQARCLTLVKALAERTPLWHMYCNQELQAAQTAFRAMSGEAVIR
ncbi:MAG: hypothetical protein IJB59_05625 [Oscillospiraceae bacterium]|nr:hypothetical protein [Oscillospiraceae bacterium]